MFIETNKKVGWIDVKGSLQTYARAEKTFSTSKRVWAKAHLASYSTLNASLDRDTHNGE